jgi:hypothetical protein
MTTRRTCKGGTQIVSSERGYGAYVDTEDVSAPLESTRVLRLALNVLWDRLSPEAETGPLFEVLTSIHDRINAKENDELRLLGMAEHYLIIRPVSPVSPPPPEIMEKIAAAVRTLTELGMVVGQHDAGYRE